jgi:Glutathione-dependent formaldehyde-activating enzyme
MRLRATQRGLRRRADQGVALSLSRLSEANGQQPWHCCLLSPRESRAERPVAGFYTLIGQRLRRGISFFHFCPQCGSNVYWEPGRLPEMIGVAVGCFADPAFPPPSQAVYDRHSHPWMKIRID